MVKHIVYGKFGNFISIVEAKLPVVEFLFTVVMESQQSFLKELLYIFIIILFNDVSKYQFFHQCINEATVTIFFCFSVA